MSLGDNNRKQAKLLQLAEMADQRHKEAEGKFDRFLDHTVSEKRQYVLSVKTKQKPLKR
jgi:hypothetical protein